MDFVRPLGFVHGPEFLDSVANARSLESMKCGMAIWSMHYFDTPTWLLGKKGAQKGFNALVQWRHPTADLE